MSSAISHPAAGQRTLHVCLWLVFAASCVSLAAELVREASGHRVCDDACMYARYADNLLDGGSLSWNPGGERTYGLTSLLYLLVVLPFRLILPQGPLLGLALSSILCGAAFLGLLAVLLLRFVDAPPLGRRLVLALVFFLLAIRGREIAYHFLTGMGTTFALAYGTLYILAAKWVERAPSFSKGVWLGLLGGGAFLARPDLAIYSAAVPLSLLLLGREERVRRSALVAGVVSALALAAVLGAAWAYFGSPLPLPFYAKSLRGYADEQLRAHHRFAPILQLALYGEAFWLLFVLIGAGIVARRRDRAASASAVGRGLLAATALYIAYYLVFVIQIMGYQWRFYAPTLPAVVFLAAQAAAAVGRRIFADRAIEAGKLPAPLCWLAALLMVYALPLEAHRTLARIVQPGNAGQFDPFAEYRAHWQAYWPGLAEISALPDDLVIATTELGRPAILNPRKTIVDLSGLNEPGFARSGFSADRLFRAYRPDVLYLPHPNYNLMLAEILAHPCFQEQYEHFSAAALSARLGQPVPMGIALRKDSRHYPALRRILTTLSHIPCAA